MRPIPATACTIFAALWCASAAAMDAPQPPDYLVQGSLPPTPAAAPGSLWNEAKLRVIIGMDGNARRVGDLITVNISEQTRTELQADTSTSRDSAVAGSIGSFFGLVNSITAANPNLGGQIGLEVSGSANYAGDGKTSREGLLTGQLTCRVMQVQPNGNLVIWGSKEIEVNRETQFLVMTGMVRPRDIQADNTVLSHLVAEARIVFDGEGVVGDKQGPGLGHRVMDHVWPF